MSARRTFAVAPAPASVGGAGASATAAAHAPTLHPEANETCHECWYPIGANEGVRAVVIGSRVAPRLLGFVHVVACSDRLGEKCKTFAEYQSLNARLVDLG